MAIRGTIDIDQALRNIASDILVEHKQRVVVIFTFDSFTGIHIHSAFKGEVEALCASNVEAQIKKAIGYE